MAASNNCVTKKQPIAKLAIARRCHRRPESRCAQFFRYPGSPRDRAVSDLSAADSRQRRGRHCRCRWQWRQKLKPVTRFAFIRKTAAATCWACRSDRANLCAQPQRLGEQVDGTYAEYLRVRWQNCFPMPAGLSFEEGRGDSRRRISSAWRMLMTDAELRPGESVLIRGIGGGVATAAHAIGD